MKLEYKPYYEKFGLNIVYYRKRKKLTQLQLADLVLHTPRLVLSEPIKTALSITRVLVCYVAIFSRIIARIFFSRLLTCTCVIFRIFAVCVCVLL